MTSSQMSMTGASMRPDCAVVVIGAGPYGLATVAHLRAAGVHTRVLGEPMEFWHQQMPVGMLLRSSKRASSISDPQRLLTLDHYARERGAALSTPLTLQEFLDYGHWFAERVAPDVDRRRVTQLEQAPGGLALTLADGERLTAQRVVVATGLAPFAARPAPLRDLPAELVSHSCEHRELGRFADSRVAVIGAGQSALESAALLHEAGAKVEVIARTPAIRWLTGRGRFSKGFPPIPLAPTDVGGRASGWITAAPDVFRRMPLSRQPSIAYKCTRPAGADWLRSRMESVSITTSRSVVTGEARNGGVRLSLDDGSQRDVDHVLLGTGYEIDVARYPFIGQELLARLAVKGGYPVLRPGLESSLAGLHFVGAPAAISFGPVMRFVVGSWFAAPSVAHAARGRRQPPIRFSF